MEWAAKWWIEAGFGIALAVLGVGYKWMGKKLKTLIREQAAMNNGTKALLRDRIIQAYNHYMDRGECPIYALENVQALYREYHALGGNGAIERLVQELKGLPRKNNTGRYDHAERADRQQLHVPSATVRAAGALRTDP